MAVSQKGMKLQLLGLTRSRVKIYAWDFIGYAASFLCRGLLFNGCLDGKDDTCGHLGEWLQKKGMAYCPGAEIKNTSSVLSVEVKIILEFPATMARAVGET